MISVSIIEDDTEISQSLEFLINSVDEFVCKHSFNNCESALEKIFFDPPDVVLMDIELPGMSGIEGIRAIRKKTTKIDIIILSVHQDDKLVFQSLCAGACGYLTKNAQPPKILSAIREVRRGGAPMSANIARMVVHSFRQNDHEELSPRETEVLSLLCEGNSYKMIAEKLFISRETVHSHIKKIYKKLKVHSEAEAVAKAFKANLTR